MSSESENHFTLTGVVELIGPETPPTITGRVYRYEDFTHPGHSLPIAACMHTLYERRRELPSDIVLATEPEDTDIDNYLYDDEEPYTALQAFLSPHGILSHGATMNREEARERMERGTFPKNFVALASVDTTQLQSGDKVEIDLSNPRRAILSVTRYYPH